MGGCGPSSTLQVGNETIIIQFRCAAHSTKATRTIREALLQRDLAGNKCYRAGERITEPYCQGEEGRARNNRQSKKKKKKNVMQSSEQTADRRLRGSYPAAFKAATLEWRNFPAITCKVSRKQNSNVLSTSRPTASSQLTPNNAHSSAAASIRATKSDIRLHGVIHQIYLKHVSIPLLVCYHVPPGQRIPGCAYY